MWEVLDLPRPPESDGSEFLGWANISSVNNCQDSKTASLSGSSERAATADRIDASD